MRKIFKYPLVERTGPVSMEMEPINGVLSFQRDPMGHLCFWADVVVDRPLIMHQLLLLFTGDEVPSGFTHAGSYVDGAIVWHLYYRP
jgi:hypothetical protein